jgi:flavin reductase (DIM6/NTAB) family NADH-FMN oxidoreductase RutF
MLVDLDGMSIAAVYHLMTQVVVPRPIAWVVSDNGVDAGDPDDRSRWNLAPFSYFNAVASDPPTVMFSVGASRRDTAATPGLKDTLSNVSVRPEHTIALPCRDQLDAVEATSAEVPTGASEFALAGLEPVAWDWPVPMPSGVRAALGCTVDRIVPVADGPQRVVLARIHRVWVDDAVVTEDAKGRPRVDATLLDPLLRLGAGDYAAMGATARPERSARPEA